METQELIIRGLLRNDDICYLTMKDEYTDDKTPTGRILITGETPKDSPVEVGQYLKQCADIHPSQYGFEILEILEVRQSRDVEEKNWYHIACNEGLLPFDEESNNWNVKKK